MDDTASETRIPAGVSLAREVAQWLRRRAEAPVRAAELVEALWPRFVAAGAVAADRVALCDLATHLYAWHSHPDDEAEMPRELGEAIGRLSSAALREFVKWLDELPEGDAKRAC